MFCLFVLLVLVSASILIFSRDVGSAERADDATPASGGDGSPGPSAPSGPSGTHFRKKNTSATVVTVAPSPKTDEQGNIITGQQESGGATVTAVRSEDQPSATTENPEPTTTERTKMPHPGRSRQPKLFVCYTVPEQLSADFEMPDDLCDVVLIGIECYGALADEQENIAWNDKWLFDIPSKYHKTKFGFVTCVMDYDEVFPDIANQKFFQLLGKVPLHYYGIGILKELWRSPTLGSVDVNAPFVYVKKIRDMFWPTAKIVYKVELDSKKNVDYFIDMCRNTLMPDLIVVTAHDYFPGPEVKKQVLLPPNIFYRPVDFWYQANYGNTMPDAMAVALTLINYGVNRPISLVVTMAGTKAQMQYPDIRNPKAGRYAIYQPAVNVYGSWFDHFTNPKAMCSGKGYEAYRANLQYQENALTWLAFNKSQNVETSMAFDTAETLRYKICQVFVNHTYDPLTQLIDFGISELAWDGEPCDLPNWKSPPYERVKMVRAVSKFLTDEYWDSSDLYFCLKVKS